MAAFVGIIQLALTLALSVGGFLLMRRRPQHTRWHLIVAAGICGGLAGAIVAALAAGGGASLSDALPFAALGVVDGSIIGLLGVAALAFGGWLNREP